MMYAVNFTWCDKGTVHHKDIFKRIGKEVYRHPRNHFVVLEFQGVLGKFRESFRPSELMPV